MPQSPLAVNVTNASPLQAPITLQTTGSKITVGNPGGPIVYASRGPILTNIGFSPGVGGIVQPFPPFT